MKNAKWGSKLGIILAVAGSAIGLGNFLRFPVQAVSNGGGAFMIPYFIALLLVGLPLIWIEWTIGRYGGGFGHSTAPGIFHTMSNKNNFLRIFGVIGIFGPIVIFVYYTYIESWLLGYAFYSITGVLFKYTDHAAIKSFLSAYQGITPNSDIHSIVPAYIFFLITFAINISILWLGVRAGIERLCKYGIPALVIMAVILLIRVFTIDSTDQAPTERTALEGLGFLWNPVWTQTMPDGSEKYVLLNPKVWMAAAGQIFFTLSVGIGTILTYASYLKRDDEVALSGLTAASANEVAEVILGGSIVITAAVMFMGVEGARAEASGGSFNLGFITMPFVLGKLGSGIVFGTIWFAMLFIAGITSSVSLAEPAIAFLEDDFQLSRKKAVSIFGIVTFVLCQAPIFFLANGVLDELDFWGGTFCLVLFGTVEVILFAWIYGIDKAWTELHVGSDITIPRFYRFIIKYITPVFLITLLVTWTWDYIKDQSGKPLTGYVIATRVGLLLFFGILVCAVFYASRRRSAAVTEPR